MGEPFTATTCFGDSFDDNDHDGIGDQCEWALAKRFAPIMVFEGDGENVGREPYWAARLASGLVTIVYFPSYYVDLGCSPNAFLGCEAYAGAYSNRLSLYGFIPL